MNEEEVIEGLLRYVPDGNDFLWLRQSERLTFNYGMGCFFHLISSDGWFGIQWIFVPESQRRKGNAKKILQRLQGVAKKLDVGAWLVCNPFHSSGFSLKSWDLKDLKYDEDDSNQSIMVNLVKSLGFKERNIGLQLNLYEVMGRAVYYNYGAMPRMFVFNCPVHGMEYEEVGLSKDTWDMRLTDFRDRYYDESKVVHP